VTTPISNISKVDSERLSRLRDSVLKDVNYSPSTGELQLTFRHWKGETSYAYLRGILHVSISNTDEEEQEPLVLSVSAEVLNDGGKQTFEALGYLWHDSAGAVRSYPGAHLIHFEIEGDTCVQVVCRQFALTP